MDERWELEGDTGVQLESQGGALDVEGRGCVPSVRADPGDVIDTTLRLERISGCIVQADDSIQRLGDVDDVKSRVWSNIGNIGPRRSAKRLLNHQRRIDGCAAGPPARADDRRKANSTKINPPLARVILTQALNRHFGNP